MGCLTSENGPDLEPILTVDGTSVRRERFERAYRVGKVLGKGGFGTVYEGERVKDSRPVAIKHVARAKITDWCQVSCCRTPSCSCKVCTCPRAKPPTFPRSKLIPRYTGLRICFAWVMQYISVVRGTVISLASTLVEAWTAFKVTTHSLDPCLESLSYLATTIFSLQTNQMCGVSALSLLPKAPKGGRGARVMSWVEGSMA